MAERRMFSKTIIDSDLFLDMSLSAQALYFHLSMRADDEGFINSPKKIIRMISAHEDDLRILIAKQFLIPFESGVVVIKHWKVHNYIRGDRITPTFHKLEKEQLVLDNNTYVIPENGEYCLTDGSQESDDCPSNDSIGKVRLGKVRLGKVRLGNNENIETTEEKKEKPKKPKNKKDESIKINYAEFVKMTSEEYQKLVNDFGEENVKRMIVTLDNYKGSHGKTYKSDYRAILMWVADKVMNTNNSNNRTNQEKKSQQDILDELLQEATEAKGGY